MKKRVIICLLLAFEIMIAQSQSLSQRKEGYLDIHHINTGRGDATFCVFPDGTTMLIDAGANSGKGDRCVKARPNDKKTPGMWIAQYVNRFKPSGSNCLDYALLTHFHADHIGGVYTKKTDANDYFLTGISEVFSLIPVLRIVDRGHQYMPPSSDDRCYTNYLGFARFLLKNYPHCLDRFVVGSSQQFTLQKDSVAYPSFQIRNLYANGCMWSGVNDSIVKLFPELKVLSKRDMPRENRYSCAIKISYGKFDYYVGGDIPGYPRPGRPQWHDVESPLSKVIGQVEVAKANHHGNGDASNEIFISTLAPQNFILSTWDALHPEHKVLYRMLSKDLYSGKRFVFATNLHPATKIVIGDLVDKMASQQGHIVVRVLPGGEEYMIYVLDDENDSCRILSSVGPFFCK